MKTDQDRDFRGGCTLKKFDLRIQMAIIYFHMPDIC